jgi:hypothetical protein
MEGRAEIEEISRGIGAAMAPHFVAMRCAFVALLSTLRRSGALTDRQIVEMLDDLHATAEGAEVESEGEALQIIVASARSCLFGTGSRYV